MPADGTHRHDEFHRGLVPQAQLGTGSTGAGTKVLYDDQTYKTPSGGGGSMTVEQTGGTPSTGSVSVIEVGSYTDNGGGDVTLFPQITGTDPGLLIFLSNGPELANAAETTALVIDTGTVYLWAEHTPSSLANEGIALQTGTGYKTIYINQKDANTIQLHSNNADVELTDDASSDVWRHVDASSVVRDLATMESRKGAGSATVVSGSTSVTVTHGAGYTPAAEDIMVTPTNSPTNDPGHWWIDTIGGTTFKINVRANPGVSGASFAWRVDR